MGYQVPWVPFASFNLYLLSAEQLLYTSTMLGYQVQRWGNGLTGPLKECSLLKVTVMQPMPQSVGQSGKPVDADQA